MRLRLDIAYDGTRFRGWARQPGLRTVQDEIEQALARILGGDPRLVVAGRTDAGVHARGQVAHLDLDEAQQDQLLTATRRDRAREAENEASADASGSEVSAPDTSGTDASAAARHPAAPALDPAAIGRVARLAHRLRGVFGPYADLTVHRTSIAPAGFDARFSPVWRRYEYRIADAISGYDPLERARTTTVRAQLDVPAMDAAARSLIGLHDFAAYCKPRPEATTIRTLLEFDWRRDADGVLVANLKADAFCHSMVRALVGACAAVGEGKLTVADAATLRDAGQRTSAFKVLAARGLTLAEVGYPADELLASRAVQTRARRGDG